MKTTEIKAGQTSTSGEISEVKRGLLNVSIAELNEARKKLNLNSNNRAYRELKREIKSRYYFEGPIIFRPVVLSGRGKWSRYISFGYDLERLLNFLNVEYEKGNDAPKGGKKGDFFRVKL